MIRLAIALLLAVGFVTAVPTDLAPGIASPTTTTSTTSTTVTTTTTTIPVRVAAVTVTRPRRPPVKPTILSVARAQVGQPEARFDIQNGFDGSGFWCAKFVSYVLTHAGFPWHDDTPSHLRDWGRHTDLPRPGDIGLVDLSPATDHGYIGHVVIAEIVQPSGDVNTIEGNGPETTRVARGLRHPAEIVEWRTVR